jgi:hypothetical protein
MVLVKPIRLVLTQIRKIKAQSSISVAGRLWDFIGNQMIPWPEKLCSIKSRPFDLFVAAALKSIKPIPQIASIHENKLQLTQLFFIHSSARSARQR